MIINYFVLLLWLTTNKTYKVKLRASNYQNINPKSRATPKEALNPFKSYKARRKTQVARDGLRFEMLQFERQVKNDDKG
ncbi:hypothetical protein VP01_12015g1, partial [Puccinia sorghi]